MGRHYEIEDWGLFTLEGYVESEIESQGGLDVSLSRVMDAIQPSEEEAVRKATAAFTKAVFASIKGKDAALRRRYSDDDIAYAAYAALSGQGSYGEFENYDDEDKAQAVGRAVQEHKPDAYMKLEDKLMGIAHKAVKQWKTRHKRKR
jgi:hypothetical protein